MKLYNCKNGKNLRENVTTFIVFATSGVYIYSFIVEPFAILALRADLGRVDETLGQTLTKYKFSYLGSSTYERS